jgi:hypothetical protein
LNTWNSVSNSFVRSGMNRVPLSYQMLRFKNLRLK